MFRRAFKRAALCAGIAFAIHSAAVVLVYFLVVQQKQAGYPESGHLWLLGVFDLPGAWVAYACLEVLEISNKLKNSVGSTLSDEGYLVLFLTGGGLQWILLVFLVVAAWSCFNVEQADETDGTRQDR